MFQSHLGKLSLSFHSPRGTSLLGPPRLPDGHHPEFAAGCGSDDICSSHWPVSSQIIVIVHILGVKEDTTLKFLLSMKTQSTFGHNSMLNQTYQSRPDFKISFYTLGGMRAEMRSGGGRWGGGNGDNKQTKKLLFVHILIQNLWDQSFVFENSEFFRI
jgi:hypothetical protein